MDIAYLSAAAALSGSVVGGLTSALTTWVSQRTQARAALLAREIARRDEVYKEFITAASKAFGDAIISSEPQITDLVALYAMVCRMRVQSSPRTVACAEKVMDLTINTYLAPNKTIKELNEMLGRNKAEIDLLKEFSEAAREDLAKLTA
ncbi:MAG: hypothetical protein ACRECE_03490 [Xanthobacteraceae bacterium]